MRRFEAELDELRRALLEMSGLVEFCIYRSVLCLTRRDPQQAKEVYRNEKRINQMQIEIDDKGTRLLALDQPVARDLRLITATLKINNDLERMGDESVNIVSRAESLLDGSFITAPIDIPHMAALVETMVRQALDAFVRQESTLARTVLESDDAVNDCRDEIHRELIAFMQKNPDSIAQCVNLIFIASSLERIADHATNIAEDDLFVVQGIDVRHHAETGTA